MKFIVVLLATAVGCIGIGCQKGTPVSTAAISASAVGAAPTPSSTAGTQPPSSSAIGVSPYKATTTIFEEFARLVATNQKSPDEGITQCRAFVTAKIPEIKKLTGQIKTIETGPDAAVRLPEIMDANEKIKMAIDRVTALAQGEYGAKGADVMLILADLALARL